VNILVTLGPSYEPIDQVRRITNHSTGALGTELAHSLLEAGHQVTSLCGSTALFKPQTPVPNQEFTTNESLLHLLLQTAATTKIDAFFHVAALGDYRVHDIHDAHGQPLSHQEKIPSRLGDLSLRLKPAIKILPQLRALFPTALIVGWKYECEGSRDDVIEKGKSQVAECQTDAVVLNGKAWGEGFGLYHKEGSLISCEDAPALCHNLQHLLK